MKYAIVRNGSVISEVADHGLTAWFEAIATRSDPPLPSNPTADDALKAIRRLEQDGYCLVEMEPVTRLAPRVSVHVDRRTGERKLTLVGPPGAAIAVKARS